MNNIKVIVMKKAALILGVLLISFGVNDEGRKFMKISDNGVGFEDPFELLIEPYYSRKTDGLGLGLYLVNEIIMRQGGRVSGYNENGAVIKIIF
jgi:nitrogen fixation/metabolism regulation signal transduction histidine kinase